MINAGILDGDYVVVRRQQDARNGDIVVALAGDDETADEATVKRFFREDGRVRLQPENAALEPIYAQSRPDPGQGDGGVPVAVSTVPPFNRTLDQELAALERGASLECLVCGEFVLHLLRRVMRAPMRLRPRRRRRGRGRATIEHAGRVTAGPSGLEESPDTAGQDAGETPGGESRRKVAQKGNRRAAPLRRRRAVRVKRWGKSPPASW